jgi:carboxyl-terminal processing protease
MIHSLVSFMRKHRYVILIPFLTVTFCWTLMTDATETEPGTLEYLELFAQCYELIQGRYLEETDPLILAEGAVEGMLLKADPYSALLPVSNSSDLVPPFGPLEIGAVIGYQDPMIRIIDILPGSPADRHGIVPGDTLIRINDQVTPYLTINRAERMLTGNTGDTITLLTQSHLTGELNELDISLEPYERQESGIQVFTKDSIRIVKLSGEPDVSTPEKLYTELTLSTENLPTVLDLRRLNRGDEVLGIRIADLFIPDGETLLHTCTGDSGDMGHVIANDGRALTDFSMAVIIDRTSAGPAETCAGALQSTGRAVVTGDTSFGKAVYREIRPLDTQYEIMLVTGFFCTPQGDAIHLKGVKPDVPVILPVEHEDDPYLATALKQLAIYDRQTD